ncbi:hypothetical protein HLB23_26010 [Nocardia uniformis]|uniref:Uncharacterized protein n=1 Tax=Nocardia uniformis TaxID=53432 RepID=A0A849CA86_9NOCA|nr:hypothetical protein [Nocardia uniformis]NNH73270.1 hypothetical protein [Nocardia uniformis]
MELRLKPPPTRFSSKRLLILMTAGVAAVGAATLLVTGTGPGMSRNHQQIPCPEPAALEIWGGGVRELGPPGSAQFLP